MTTQKDTTPGRPRSQEAALDRLRAKGNHLAPVMVDGRVRPKGSKQPSTAGAETGAGRPVAPGLGESPRPAKTEGLASAFPGSVFDLIVPAPCEFLNANRDKSLHWAEKGRRVASWRYEGLHTARLADLPKGLPRVRIDAYVRKPIANRFDPANWAPTAKAVVDGLVTDYGLCEDDNRHFVEGPFMHDGGRGEPALRVVVTVLEAKERAA